MKSHDVPLSLFVIATTIIIALFSNGCDEIHSTSSQGKSIIPEHTPSRQALKRIPELFIYTNSKITSNYCNAYFYFFDASEHFTYFTPTENFENFGYIKKRGNSTAQSPKRPYNIKFDEKVDFLGMGKAKKWVLLSNPFDPTLIRNKLIYDLASNLSFAFSPKSYFIDVWLNDVFMGNYQISEKIEFQKNRIPYSTENGDFLFEVVESEQRNKANDVYFHTPVDSIVDFFHDSFNRNYSDSGWAYCDTLEITDNQERRQLSCPYNPVPLPTFDENIHFLKEWIIERNQYLKQTVSRKLDELNHIDITLERAFAIQDSIFRSK